MEYHNRDEYSIIDITITGNDVDELYATTKATDEELETAIDKANSLALELYGKLPTHIRAVLNELE